MQGTIIQEELGRYLNNPDATIVAGGTFNGKDFKDLMTVLNGTDKDFVLWANGGGKLFDIMFDTTYTNSKGKVEHNRVSDFVKFLLKHHMGWLWCYQLNGDQVIIRKFN